MSLSDPAFVKTIGKCKRATKSFASAFAGHELVTLRGKNKPEYLLKVDGQIQGKIHVTYKIKFPERGKPSHIYLPVNKISKWLSENISVMVYNQGVDKLIQVSGTQIKKSKFILKDTRFYENDMWHIREKEFYSINPAGLPYYEKKRIGKKFVWDMQAPL